jgi:ribonuclease HI
VKARLFTDGGARGNPGPAAYGYVIEADDGTVLAAHGEKIGVATNNVAEYRALIAGLEAAAPFNAHTVHVRADSLLVIKQLRGEYRVKHANLRPLHEEARALLRAYRVADLQHVPRAQNAEADALVNAALDAR